MQTRNLHRFLYQLRHRYATMNNAVIAIAVFIAISWAWASVGVVQKNYTLQREVDAKLRQKQLIELETQSLAYEQRYYKSSEYLTLEIKRRLNLAEPGEKVVVLPPNTEAAKQADKDPAQTITRVASDSEPIPFQQWMNFLLGGNNQRDT